MTIQDAFNKQKQYYLNGRTRDISQRRQALEALAEAIRRYEPDIIEALRKDLSKSDAESYSTEIGFVLHEARFIAKRLHRWAKPRRVKTALTHVGSRGMTMPEPYGTTLVIAPWNYPFQLAIAPLIGAISAGNTVILKPSELTPHTSKVISRLIGETFDPQLATVVEGGVETSQELLAMPFDYIFFTGSVGVGKIVMEAAAKQLIPLTLELGGKSPCIVHQDANIPLSAKRIAFGKWTNAGQTCVAPDYVYVHRSKRDELVKALQQAVTEFYGASPLTSPDYPSIVSTKHLDRQAGFLNDGTLAWGGDMNAAERRLAPAVLTDITWDMPVMQDEIFGPILPVLVYDDLQEVISAVQARPKPLALYLFTNDRAVEERVLTSLSFGGGCVNDTLMHLATPYLPFGGVGESGMGAYHGKFSFETFSHQKSVLHQTTLVDMAIRYPGAKNGLKWMRKLLR
ncbi:aldehyde dehydrogenase [Paenibacillus marinisediminis]